jgi:Pvc16 N-terminal domain
MYTTLRATSVTLAQYLRQRLQADPFLATLFNPGGGGTMDVYLKTPKEMTDVQAEGLSIWLYRVVRDEESLNDPPERISNTELKQPPLPLRLHYLISPVVINQSKTNPNGETEQAILGKVLQAFYDRPLLSGVDLQDDLSGTSTELRIRFESLTLDETSRLYDALEGPFQLSVSYEVSVVYISSEIEAESISPVQVVMPEYGVIVSP